MSSEAAAKRVLAGIGNWIEKHLRLQVNEAKSGARRPWERKFLGFRINRRGQREVARKVSSDSSRRCERSGAVAAV